MRADTLNLDTEPVRMEMPVINHIPISRIFSTEKGELKEYLVNKNLSQVYSTDEGKSESIITAESSTEEIKLESVHKIINKENIQLKKQKTRNLRLQRIHLSRSRAILTYLSVAKLS